MLQRAEKKFRINHVAIEKDWWVTVVLNALFKCSCADQLIFKGGTSLSKGWNLIERFSEDIDLSVSHEFFGIEKTTKNQREKLRKKARRYFLLSEVEIHKLLFLSWRLQSGNLLQR